MNFLDPSQSIQLVNQRLETLHHEAQIEHAMRELRRWTWLQFLPQLQSKRLTTAKQESYISTKWERQ